MRKISSLICILVLVLPSVYGQGIDENTAKIVGKTFLIGKTSVGNVKSSKDLELVYTVGSKSNNTSSTGGTDSYFYVFNTAARDGFVIVSGNEKAVPILAYSNEGIFDPNSVPQNVAKWLEGYKGEIRFLIENKTSTTDEIGQAWETLKNGEPQGGSTARTASVSSLIQTEWDQFTYYNDLCPFDTQSNTRTVTGCVATAMAQIMKFWNYPANGTGFHSYNHPTYGTLSANFGSTTYQWNSMPGSINSSNSSLATLMYHCGVSVDMNYGPAQCGCSSF